MKRLFTCVKKQKDKNSLIELEKEEVMTTTISWSSNETQNALSQSPFAIIPNEIIVHIFRFLSVPDLCNVSLVCRCFKMIADQDEIWKWKCHTSTKLHSKSYKEIYMQWISNKSKRNEQLQQFEERDWSRTACVICLPPSYPVRPTGKNYFQSIGNFNQHPNSSQGMTITLSVDLDKTVPELISLLEKASPFQQQYQQSLILKQMIQRYYRFMQLKASHPVNILLIPTLDIEIIWQTHLLRPEIYHNDCLRLFRRVIDHSLVLNDVEQMLKEQAFIDTCRLYEERFAAKYCSLPTNDGKRRTRHASIYDSYEDLSRTGPIYAYWDATRYEFSSMAPKDYENPFSFTEGDVILDGKWLQMCKQFMSNATEKVPIRSFYSSRSLKIDLGPGALKRLKKSYERFLYMAAKYPLKGGNGFIPPTYAIDIMWHTHMQEPLKYVDDCKRVVGYVIYHDPWPMVEDKSMKKSCDDVDRIWKDEFQSEINTDHLYNTSDNNDIWFG